MEFQDKALRCVDCGSEFIWTAGEQLFFADKQFKNEPKRCKACKAKRANRVNAGTSMRDRIEPQTTCSACGKETTVPFRPTRGGPAFTRGRFRKRNCAVPGGGRLTPQRSPPIATEGRARRLAFQPNIFNHADRRTIRGRRYRTGSEGEDDAGRRR